MSLGSSFSLSSSAALHVLEESFIAASASGEDVHHRLLGTTSRALQKYTGYEPAVSLIEKARASGAPGDWHAACDAVFEKGIFQGSVQRLPIPKRHILYALVPHAEEMANIAGISEVAERLRGQSGNPMTPAVPWWFGRFGSILCKDPKDRALPLELGALGVGAGAIALARLNDIRNNVEGGYVAEGHSSEPHLVTVPYGLYDTVLVNVFGRSPTKKGLEGVQINEPGRIRIRALLPLLGPQDYFVIDKSLSSRDYVRAWKEGRLTETHLIDFARRKYQTYRSVRSVEGDGRAGTKLHLSDGTVKTLGSREVLYPRPGRDGQPENRKAVALTQCAFEVFEHQVMGVPSGALPSVLSPDKVAALPFAAVLTFDQKSLLPGGDLVPTFVKERLEGRPDVRPVYVDGLNFAVMSFRGDRRDLELASETPKAAMRVGHAIAGDRLQNPYMTVEISTQVLTDALGSAGKNIIALMSGRRLMELVLEAIQQDRSPDWVKKNHHKFLRQKRDLLKNMAVTYGIDPAHPFSRQVLTDYDGTTGLAEASIQYEALMRLTREALAETDRQRRKGVLLELTKQIRSRNVTLMALLELFRHVSESDPSLEPDDMKPAKITVEGVSAVDNYMTYAEAKGKPVPPDISDLAQYLWELGEIRDEPEGVFSQIISLGRELDAYDWPESGVSGKRVKFLARLIPRMFQKTADGLRDREELPEAVSSQLAQVEEDFAAINRKIGWLEDSVRLSIPDTMKAMLGATLSTLMRLNLRYDRRTRVADQVQMLQQTVAEVRRMIETARFT